MAITPFKAMKFVKNEVITKSDMDQINNNLLYIHEKTPRGRLVVPGGSLVEEHTMLVGGRALIRKNKKDDRAVKPVRFPAGAFAPNCRPSVTTGIVSEQTSKIFCAINGPDNVNYPNASGFDVVVEMAILNKENDKIIKEFWVHWHAFGYRSVEVGTVDE